MPEQSTYDAGRIEEHVPDVPRLRVQSADDAGRIKEYGFDNVELQW